MGFRAGLDAFAEDKNLLPLPGIEHRTFQLIDWILY